MSLARNLRTNATPEERAPWRVLGSVRPRFTRQLKVGPFIADFACRRARVIVELDGSQHVDNDADDRRTALLESDGWRVIRFWNKDVQTGIEGVAETILQTISERLPATEAVRVVASRAGRDRRPRTRTGEKEPPPAPPRSRGGE